MNSIKAEHSRLDAAIARLPLWMLGLAAAGTIATAWFFGLRFAGGFLLGSLAAWLNLRLLIRAVDKIGTLAAAAPSSKINSNQRSFWVLAQLAGLVLAAFVILSFSGFSRFAALCGFFVCPSAVIVEIIYEILKYDHS